MDAFIKGLRFVVKTLLECTSSTNVAEPQDQQQQQQSGKTYDPQQDYKAPDSEEQEQYKPVRPTSTGDVEIGRLTRYDSNICDFKQFDSQGNRIFPEADACREEADREAKLRGECYDQSQEAYNAGDGAKAKELSNKGKDHGRRMEEANARAVRAIVDPQRAEETGCLDLHGLRVAEAEAVTRDFLLDHRNRGQFEELEVITGAGNHSTNHKAKIKHGRVITAPNHKAKIKELEAITGKGNDGINQRAKPMVEDMLRDMQFNFHSKNEGAYVITLSSRQ
ncbi:hypothetical protein JKP88DRAFT_351974 [Tribonema minus]|uniref:Smr domain-containing protein n=1 Tax=Tribonema minus TaxID=303371 RepID=A0A835ZGC0_9STRA|nr:hypothetical protein JKP88DRAFT_351974 [Tribonema minus]